MDQGSGEAQPPPEARVISYDSGLKLLMWSGFMQIILLSKWITLVKSCVGISNSIE